MQVIHFCFIALINILIRQFFIKAFPDHFSLSAFDHKLFYDYLLKPLVDYNHSVSSDLWQLTVDARHGRSGDSFLRIEQLIIHKDDPLMIVSIIKFCIDVQTEFDMCLKIRDAFQRKYQINLDTYENNILFVSIFNLQFQDEFLLTDEEKRLNDLDELPQSDSTCHNGWVTVADKTTVIDGNNRNYHNVSFHMYVVTHDDASEQALYNTIRSDNNALNSSSAVLFNNLSIVRVRSTVFFEYILYKDFLPFSYHHHSNNNQQVVSWGQLDYVGVTSYKTMRQYYSLCRHEIDRLLTLPGTQQPQSSSDTSNSSGNKQQYDVIPLLRSKKSLLVKTVFSHGTKFKQVWDAVLFPLGYNETIVRRHDHIRPFYRNSYLIRPEWLKKLTVFMNTAIDTVLLNSTLYDIVAQPVLYGSSQNKEVARRIFNSDTYQYFPFVFERLPVFYLTVEGANICHGDAVDCPYNIAW